MVGGRAGRARGLDQRRGVGDAVRGVDVRSNVIGAYARTNVEEEVTKTENSEKEEEERAWN